MHGQHSRSIYSQIMTNFDPLLGLKSTVGPRELAHHVYQSYVHARHMDMKIDLNGIDCMLFIIHSEPNTISPVQVLRSRVFVASGSAHSCVELPPKRSTPALRACEVHTADKIEDLYS